MDNLPPYLFGHQEIQPQFGFTPVNSELVQSQQQPFATPDRLQFNKSRKAKNQTDGEDGTSQDTSGVGRDETRISKTNRTPADPVGGPAAKQLKVLGIWSEARSTEQAQRKVRREIWRLARKICITDTMSADSFDWCLLIEQILRMPKCCTTGVIGVLVELETQE